mgnify:CR=1 FL=1
MKIFDAHVHIFPDRIGPAATAALGRESGITPTYDGTRSGLLASMRTAGISGALNCPIATKAEQVESINSWAVARHGWPVLSLGTVHPDHTGNRTELQRIAAKGLPGIKLHPEYQQFNLEDARLEPVWQLCSELGLVVMMHCGADIAFEPPFHSTPATIAKLLERFPQLLLIAAHFGSWNMWQDVEKNLIGKAVYFDMSFAFGLLEDAKLVELSRTHGISRILFGTDAPWRNQANDLQYFFQLGFSETEQHAILWDNAARLFDLEDLRRRRQQQ